MYSNNFPVLNFTEVWAQSVRDLEIEKQTYIAIKALFNQVYGPLISTTVVKTTLIMTNAENSLQLFTQVVFLAVSLTWELWKLEFHTQLQIHFPVMIKNKPLAKFVLRTPEDVTVNVGPKIELYSDS